MTLEDGILARHDPRLEPHFYGTVPCSKLPRHPQKDRSVGYIVNTNPHDRPGRHWIALWTTPENVCEIFDSYALPLQVYETTQPTHIGNTSYDRPRVYSLFTVRVAEIMP